MENPFKNFSPAEKNINNVEPDKNAEIEKEFQFLESVAENDLENFGQTNENFVVNFKKSNEILGNTPELDLEIKSIQEKYEKEKKVFKSSFLSKLKNSAKYTAIGLYSLALVAHVGKKELPEYLDKTKEPEKIEWNESTNSEIEKLSNEYALLIKEDTSYQDIPDSFFKERMVNFVAKYGPDIKVVHPGDNMGLGDKMSDFVFQKVLRQREGKAHVAIGNSIFYEEKNLKMAEDSSGYDWDSSSLSDFFAEFAHHINRDWSFRRSLAYAEDLARRGFQQGEMYSDINSAEFQAHDVTQGALGTYFFPNTKEDLKYDFEDIYNIYQDYYRELIKTRGYENNDDIELLTWDVLSPYQRLEEVFDNKEVVFTNLNKVRDLLDNLPASQVLKSTLFSVLTSSLPLSKADNDYERIIDEHEGIQEILDARNLALKDSKKMENLGEVLLQKLKNDDKYIYANFTKRIFDDNFLKKLSGDITDVENSKIIERVLRIYIYSLSRAIEGTAHGYADLNDYPKQWAYEQYQSYSRDMFRYYSKEEDVDYVRENYRKVEEHEELTTALEHYIKKDPSELNKSFEKASRAYQPIILRLKQGLAQYGNVDLNRDFYIDGKSPLSKILE